MSSFEMAKGYTKPVVPGHLSAVPDGVFEAQLKLQVKRKLAQFPRSETFEEHFTVGDMIEVYSNTSVDRKGK